MSTIGSSPGEVKHKNRPVGKPDYAPLLVAATALAGYLLIFLLLFNRYGDLRDFIFIGKQFIARSDSSAIIKMDPGYAYLEEVPGYDGQFAYFIALDPLNARYYVDQDRVSYRYTRILYPMLARSLVLGDPGWIPLSMVLVNLLAVTGGTFAVALWCRERRLSPWLGLVFAFYIGQVVAFSRDLNEILAYSLVAVAVYLFDHVPQRPILAALCFGLSALARETTLLFALVYIVALWARTLKDTGDQPGSQSQRWAKVASFGALAIGPAVLWQLCLLWWLGDIGWRQGTGLYLVPFANLYKLYPLDEGVLELGGSGSYSLDDLPGRMSASNVEVFAGPPAQGAMGNRAQCRPVCALTPTGQPLRYLRLGAHRHSRLDGSNLLSAIRPPAAVVPFLHSSMDCTYPHVSAEPGHRAYPSQVKHKGCRPCCLAPLTLYVSRFTF